MTKNSWIMAWAVLLSSIVTEVENESVLLIALKISIYLFLHQHGTTQLRGTQRVKSSCCVCVEKGGMFQTSPLGCQTCQKTFLLELLCVKVLSSL